MAGSIAYTDDGNMTVMGNMRVGLGVLTATDGSGEAVPTGFKQVVGFSATPASQASAALGAMWTNSAGSLTPSTCTSGDTFEVVIFGK